MGRIFFVSVICAAITVLLPIGTSASTLSIPAGVDASAFRIVQDADGKYTVVAQGMRGTNFLELPSLPYSVLTVLLPQGEDVVSCRLEGGSEVELSGSVSLAPFAGELNADGTRGGIYISPDEATGDDSVFPAWKVRHIGTSGWRGYSVAVFQVFPVSYDMSAGRLTAVEDMTLVVETAPGDPGLITRRLRHVEGFRDRSRRGIRSHVANPQESSAYTFDDIAADDGGREFLPSYMPGIEGSEVKYLIITSEEMEEEFQRLADWKTVKGMPAVVRTIEWIEQNTRAGADLAETIRNFIQEAYAKWGVEYVLLGGDTKVIPERNAYTSYYTGEFIPTDMYYGCLDGTWNADGDSLWGEGFSSLLDPGDGADLYAEVFVGRLPAITAADAELLVDKQIAYEMPSETASKSDFLLLGEVISPSDYTPGATIWSDGADYLQSIHNQYLAADPDINSLRLYENYPPYPGSSELTVVSSIEAMNAGVNHVVHAGHGGKYNMSVGNGSMLNNDAGTLTNGDKLFSMYLMNCQNAAFDSDCIAEYFMLNPTGGAFAVTGSSRSAFPTASRMYMDEYYAQLFLFDVVQIGRTLTKSREPFTPGAFAETSDRWTHFITVCLGDPEAAMFRGTPGVFDVTAPASVPFGYSGVTIQVNSGGMPFDSAHVCLYKEGDDYQYGYTDASGQVVFPDFLCRESGTITLTVTGLDHCRYSSTIDVEPAAGVYLALDRVTPVDTLYNGNGDGMIDTGEQVNLWLRLRNTGDGTASKLWAEVSTIDPAVTVLGGSATYPDIAAGGSARSYYPMVIAASAAAADETPVEFLLEIHDSTGGYWNETFAVELHAPELELYVNEVHDSLPVGDGDGIITASENYVLKVGVKNFGTGTASRLKGRITSIDPGIVVVDSLSDYQDLASMEAGFGDGFIIYETNVLVENHFSFEVTDTLGRTFSAVMELRRPAAPVGLMLDSSVAPDQIHATWHQPDSLESYRYIVCHSTVSGGPYTRASRDLLLHPIFRDRNLEYSTRYYLVAACVDSCGNVGPFCDEVSETTNPPQLPGWPNLVDKGSSCSPKVGDVDGDTHPDVVFGAGDMYAWDSRGFELIDGDNLPLTWGVLSTEGETFTASVALAELDGVDGLEIVGASWDTKEIYVFTRDGSVLPGWPQTTKQLCWASPVIGDFDGDGDNEIIAYDVSGMVYVWHHNGNELRNGDGDAGTNGPFYQAGPASDGWHISTPALADMDSDGVLELVVAAPSDYIYVLNSTGSSVYGWPVHIGDEGAGVGASPVVGDIDNDSYPEVIMQNAWARVLGLNHDGTPMTGWPKWVHGGSFFAGSSALADLTGDGYLEVVIPAMNGFLHIYRYDGSALPGWPQPFSDGGSTESSPVIADINEDGSLDIILGCESGKISAWDIDGNYIAGFPIQLKNFIRGTPEVRDLDLDGDLELVAACWDENVYVWDLGGAYYRDCIQWTGFHGNRFNSGWKNLNVLTDAAVTAWMYEIKGGSLRLTWEIAGGAGDWDLYRREGGSEYELAAENLVVGDDGTLSWTDGGIVEGATYEYRLESAEGTDAVETGTIEIPVTMARLYQNHPNPFNPTTTISFTIPGGSDSRSNALLNVYDVRGALVKTLINGPVQGGRHEITWDGTNNRGAGVSSGIYFAKFASDGVKSVKKMVLIR